MLFRVEIRPLTRSAGVVCRFCIVILFDPPSIFDKRIFCNTKTSYDLILMLNE
jgi:hypothetical protein